MNIDLSILIPTYNRAKYIDKLLEYFVDEIYQFDFTYEILISDNHSIDNTRQVIESYKDKLEFEVFYQKSNIEEKSILYLISIAKGDYLVYLGDDDRVDFELLNVALKKIKSHKNAVVIYTPWQCFDYKKNQSMGLFYDAPAAYIKENDFYSLGKLVISNLVFAEIGIYKTEVFQSLFPIRLNHFFFAFKYPIELLTQGDIIFENIPYHKTLLSYNLDDVDEERPQQGFDQVKTIYYKYRNSLFHLLRLMKVNKSELEISMRQNIDKFMLQRLHVALDITYKNQQFSDAYELASIIIGEYNDYKYKINFDNIKEFAKLDYLKIHLDSKKLKKIIVIKSDIDDSEKKFIVKFFNKFDVNFNDYKFVKDALYYIFDDDINNKIENLSSIPNDRIFFDNILTKKYL